MFKILFFGYFLYSFIINSALSMSTNSRILNLRFPLQERIPQNFSEDVEINSFQQLLKNNSNNATDSNILFWALSDMNNTLQPDLENEMKTETEPVLEDEKTDSLYENLDSTYEKNSTNRTQSKPTENDQTNEENSSDNPLSYESDELDSTIDEKIVLHRKNCNLEIPIPENQCLKIKIEFQNSENNTSGRCCITLNGPLNNFLALVISNIHLYQNASQREVIKVIIADYGSNFVLKEYYSGSKYQPLLLTESHKVYIVLDYEFKSVPLNEQHSHFNLEVFSYHKNENSIQNGNIRHQSQFSNSDDVQHFFEAENFFF